MLAKRPPMGWNSWNTFTKDINEEMIKQTADTMVEKGLLEAGYEYLVIDDCWSEMERDADGNLVADHVKFPNGMKAVADYVHSKGLKFGMYSCCGPKTCAGYPGSFGYEFQDAKYFAELGVDLLKYDNCYHPSTPAALRYNRMSLALKATGREILYSACNWGGEDVWQWARSVGAHMYRSTGDITDTFESIRKLSESQLDKLAYSAPGCYNDIDMLVAGLHGKGNIGFGKGCTDAQYRYHFALWCMFLSPLMIGCDIRNMSKEIHELLTNKELIAINQDEEARPPMFVRDNHGMCDNIICFRHLANGDFAIGFFNPYDKDQTIMLPYFEIGLDPLCGYGFEVKDCFTGENLGVKKDYFEVKVGAGDCRVFRAKLVPVK
ncbi:MAG: glycoside hydrolase family 27 protein [Lachnospiraceae bacterium]|nr:glycoside hydrolase family 27 protein [Lachnospiraceae bacterium]